VRMVCKPGVRADGFQPAFPFDYSVRQQAIQGLSLGLSDTNRIISGPFEEFLFRPPGFLRCKPNQAPRERRVAVDSVRCWC
jgi:hypothetical protein